MFKIEVVIAGVLFVVPLAGACWWFSGSSTKVEAIEDMERVKQEPIDDPFVSKAEVSMEIQGGYREGDTVSVDCLTYTVWESRRVRRQGKYQDSKKVYLFVDLAVCNEYGESQEVPVFNVIDEEGLVYKSRDMGEKVKDSIVRLESLCSSVDNRGYLVFLVPEGKKYWLRLPGVSWSTEGVHVALSN